MSSDSPKSSPIPQIIAKLSEEEYKTLENAIIERTKAQIVPQFQREQQKLRGELDVRIRTENELKATLHEAISEYEKLVEVHAKSEQDSKSRNEIIDIELRASRKRVEDIQREHKILSDDLRKTKADAERLKKLNVANEAKLQESVDSLMKSKSDFEKLQEHAQTKLTKSAELYVNVLSQANERHELLKQAQAELSKTLQHSVSLQTRLDHTTDELRKVSTMADKLEREMRDKSLETVAITANLTKANADISKLHAKSEELFHRNERYKQDIVQMREQIRQLHLSEQRAHTAERMLKEREDDLQNMETQNQTLKATLFDKLESEKSLQERLKLFSGGQSPDVRGLHDRIAALQKELQVKESDNKELLSVCEDLMQKIEHTKIGSPSPSPQPPPTSFSTSFLLPPGSSQSSQSSLFPVTPATQSTFLPPIRSPSPTLSFASHPSPPRNGFSM